MVITRLQGTPVVTSNACSSSSSIPGDGQSVPRRAAASDGEQIGIALSDDDFTEQSSYTSGNDSTRPVRPLRSAPLRPVTTPPSRDGLAYRSAYDTR